MVNDGAKLFGLITQQSEFNEVQTKVLVEVRQPPPHDRRVKRLRHKDMIFNLTMMRSSTMPAFMATCNTDILTHTRTINM